MALQRDNAPAADFDREPRRTPEWAPAVEQTAFRRSGSARFEPRPPAEVVYVHATAVPSGLGRASDQPTVTHATRKARRPSRGMIPLLWTAAFAGAALMHAAEVDRRASLREPSPVELQMQERPTRQIKAVWRSMSDRPAAVSAVPDAQAKPKDAGSLFDVATEVTPAQRVQTRTNVSTATNTAVAQNSVIADRPTEEPMAPADKAPDQTATTNAEAARGVLATTDTLPPADKSDDLRLHGPDPDHIARSHAAPRPPAHGSHARRRKRSLAVAVAANDSFQARYDAAFLVFEYVARRTP